MSAREVVTLLHSHGQLTDADVGRFFTVLGERVRSLTNREAVAGALVHFGFITNYVRGRVLAGNLAGLSFGPYRVLDRAGAGTVGVVFLGEHMTLRRRVALKVLSGSAVEHSDAQDRLITEARVLASIDHPHVVRAYDAGVVTVGGEDYWYLAVEWAGGGDLEHAVYNRGVAGVPTGCRWGWQAAAGLDAAHRAGLVHRDVKPSNLLLDDAERVKVADFGLVRDPATDRTPVNAVVGSLQFLAPEQLNDPTAVGPAADVYGLGATLYWVMSGRLPRPDGTPSEVVAHLRANDADRLKSVLPTAPDDLDDLLAGMLDRNPAARPTMAQVMAVFARHAATTGRPELTARGLIGSDNTDTLRTAVGQLEGELAETRRHRDDACRAILTALHGVLGVRDDGSQDRAKRVGTYAAVIAEHLGQHPYWSGYRDPDARAELAAVAATVDLGRLGLNEPPDADELGRTPSEEHEYRRHPIRTAAVFDEMAELPTPLPFLRVARDAARHHHEHWDGTGWPDALKGKQIPPVARVIAVADEFESLTSGRCADPALALAELAKRSGTAFDPDVVAAAQAAAEELSALVLPALVVLTE